jgi:uncharacterized membrane protein YecN with MAPEG domain
MTLFEITALYTALNILLLIILTIRVGQVRLGEKINLGDGGNDDMNRRIRAHGNYIEYAPLSLLGLFAMASLSALPFMLHMAGGAFLIARIFHAIGMDAPNAAGKGRLVGMILTLLTLLGQVGAILFLIFSA